jgi:hypothetical protein
MKRERERGRKEKKKREEEIEFGWCSERIYIWRAGRKINPKRCIFISTLREAIAREELSKIYSQ